MEKQKAHLLGWLTRRMFVAIFPLIPLVAVAQFVAPTVSSYSPTSGTVGTIVTIDGANLDYVDSALWGADPTGAGNVYLYIVSQTPGEIVLDMSADFLLSPGNGYIVLSTYYDLNTYLVPLPFDLTGTSTGTSTPIPIGDSGAQVSIGFDPKKQVSVGGPVDLATLGETITHPLLTLSGARSLEFTLFYSSVLAGGNQYIAAPSGGGSPYWTLFTPGDVGQWTDNFEGQATLTSGTGGAVNMATILVSHRQWNFVQNGSSYQAVNQAAAYDTLVLNNDGSYTLTTKDQSTYTFSGPGLYLTQETNPHGQAIVIARNASGQLVTATEPVSGKTLSFAYGTTGNAAGLISTVTDSAGRSVSLAYDSNGMLIKITEANQETTSFTYDSGRHLLTEADDLGNILTSNTYSTNPAYAIGYVTSQTDARGNQYSFAYTTGTDANGNPTTIDAVTDRNSYVSYYVFDQNGNLTSYISPLGEMTSYAYDSDGNLLTKTDPLGNLTSYYYNTNGDAILIMDALNKSTVMTYDGSHNLLSLIDPDDNVSSFTYDGNNNLLTAKDGLGDKFYRTYDSNSLLLSSTNPRGGATTYTYLGGLPSMVTDPAGNTISLTFDTVGDPYSLTDAAGDTTTYHFGTLRQLLEVDDALGNKLVNTYDWRLRKSTVTDFTGATTGYSYDGNNNIVSSTNALNETTTFVYDKEDRPIQVIDPLGHISARSYDPDGRLDSSTDETGDITSYTYDAASNLIKVMDPLGYTVATNSYDACNRTLSSTDALNRTWSQTYDGAGLILAREDPLNRITSFVNDALGRVTGVTDPSTAVTGQSFDPDGNTTVLTNANGNKTGFTFDLSDRLTQAATPSGETTAYGYNSRNEISSQSLPSGSVTTLTYDALGRVSTAADPIGTITYTYDNDGRVTNIAEALSSGTTNIGRQYDALGRLIQYTDAAGDVIAYAYDIVGNLSTVTYPDGKKVTYAYDPAHRLTKVTDWANRVTSYTYDADSRVVTITTPDRSVETFTCDAMGQITQSVDQSPIQTVDSINYTFDSGGKITAEGITPSPAVYSPPALSLTVDADNRLTGINGNAAVSDSNGNLTQATIPGSGISSLAYDARNRLLSAGGLAYGYDAEDRRIAVTSTAGTTEYVINSNAALDQVLVKSAPDGTVTRYVYGLGLIGEETNSTFSTYHYDHRGSTIALTDTNGNVIQTFSYGPNGEPANFDPATAPTQFLYGGLYGVTTDANGLCYMRARYYLPGISRFINQDTLLGRIDPGVSLNRFAYANDDPTGKNDPFRDYPLDAR